MMTVSICGGTRLQLPSTDRSPKRKKEFKSYTFNTKSISFKFTIDQKKKYLKTSPVCRTVSFLIHRSISSMSFVEFSTILEHKKLITSNRPRDFSPGTWPSRDYSNSTHSRLPQISVLCFAFFFSLSSFSFFVILWSLHFSLPFQLYIQTKSGSELDWHKSDVE